MSEVLTFLFTDIEGSSRLWEEDAGEAESLLARHDALLTRTVEDRRGRVFKTTGDGILAVFHDPSEAVAAALEAQLALTDLSVRIRMVLHAGMAQQRDGDFHGPTLNRASRLLAAAHGGQILLTRSVAELVRGRLAAESGLLDLGEHRLRDLPDPEHVFQLRHPKLPGSFPPLNTLATVANNLPVQLTSFVGRRRELEEVVDLLGSTRLLTLVGVGGSGKTRLAIQAASQALYRYPDGVWFVDLAAIGDPGVVAQEVAAVLGLREHGGRSATQVVVDALRHKHLLIILDNCEHLLETVADLAQQILENGSRISILATSREGLAVPGEVLWTVPPMEIGDGDGDALRLFAERAAAARSDFQLTESMAPLVTRICRRLDGIPLAIELAASRVRSFPLDEIAGRLDDRFRLLTGGRRSLARHQTLLAAVDWSYDLLSPQEQELFARLSVFAGGWTLVAAESVCGPEVDIFELLPRLVDRSLVVLDEEGRYRMLETLRQYGRERLVQRGESDQLQGRHADYYLVFAETALSGLRSPEQRIWLDRLLAELDNLRAALEWSMEADPDTALRLVAVLWEYWYLRGHWSEGRRRLDEALALRTTSRAVRVGALIGNAILSGTQGEFRGALARAEEALAEARRLEDPLLMARALVSIGVVSLNWQTDSSRAEAALRESLALAEAAGDPWSIANAMEHLGDALVMQGRYEEGIALIRQTADRWTARNDQIRTAQARYGLAQALTRSGDLQAALPLLEESAGLFEELGDRGMAIHVRASQGNVARYLGDLGRAEEILSTVRDELAELGDRGCAAITAIRLAGVELDRGQPDRAVVPLRQGLRGLAEMNDSQRASAGLQEAARLAMTLGHPEQAATVLAAAEAIRERVGTPLPEVDRNRHEELHAALKSTLDPDRLRAAQTRGSEMELDQAVHYVLAED